MPTNQPSDHTPLGKSLLCDLCCHNYMHQILSFAATSLRSEPLTSMQSTCIDNKHLFYRTIFSVICVSNGWTLQILLPQQLERAFSRVLGFSPNLPRFITIQSIISLKKASHDGLNPFYWDNMNSQRFTHVGTNRAIIASYVRVSFRISYTPQIY